MAEPVLTRITLATTNTGAMVGFYNAVFEACLEPVAAFGTTLYRGVLGGVELVLCPNEIAGVDARQNRHQFHYHVSDVAAVRERALAAGGTADGAGKSLTVQDPDGNTIEFVEE